VKLAVALSSPSDWQWLQGLDLASRGIEVAPLLLGAADGLPPGVQVRSSRLPASDVEVPELRDLVQSFRDLAPDACLVVDDGPVARLVALAADLTGAAVFSLVATSEQLDNLPRRTKPRPDLFFLTDQSLLPKALLDARYGSTLLPIGDPAHDAAPDGERAAGARLVDAVARWNEGRLEAMEPALSVIVPAFREAANLPLVCGRLLEALEPSGLGYEVLLVDDASPDDTYRVALEQMWRSPRIRAFSKPLPRGMGNAIRYGIERARAPVLAVTMGDGSDEVARIPDMVAKVRDEGYGLAIGSRYRHRVNYQTVPRLYRFWSACFRLCTRLLVGLRLSDYTNAFRAFDRRVFARYGPEGGGFEISPEITFKAWFATHKVAEVDVRHLKRAAGQSSFSFLRAGPGYGKILFKAFVNRLTGRWFTLDW
jgi:dolichol-phosphate mannosyltransferase